MISNWDHISEQDNKRFYKFYIDNDKNTQLKNWFNLKHVPMITYLNSVLLHSGIPNILCFSWKTRNLLLAPTWVKSLYNASHDQNNNTGNERKGCSYCEIGERATNHTHTLVSQNSWVLMTYTKTAKWPNSNILPHHSFNLFKNQWNTRKIRQSVLQASSNKSLNGFHHKSLKFILRRCDLVWTINLPRLSLSKFSQLTLEMDKHLYGKVQYIPTNDNERANQIPLLVFKEWVHEIRLTPLVDTPWTGINPA